MTKQGNGNGHFDFQEAMRAAGYESDAALGKTLRVSGASVCQWRRGRYAPNHPMLDDIAEKLGVSQKALSEFARLKPLELPVLARLKLARKRNSRPGTAVVLSSKKIDGRSREGRMARLAGRAAERIPRNKLKRGEHGLRQAARSLATTVNVATMQGTKYLEAVPTDAVALVLIDYFARLGVKGNVIVDPAFAELFD